MHLLVPFAAAASAQAGQALQGLRLPQLERLLAALEPGAVLGSDEPGLNLPHEHALAALRGWRIDDGRLPFAAAAARADGLDVAADGEGWALLTPAHWEVGREQVVLRDPAELALDADASRAFVQALQPLFADAGWRLQWGAPLRWYAVHASLATLATASLDRVIGHAIDPWLPDRLAGRALRRLQAEVQMLLHDHPLNRAREDRGALPVNSFWASGTGPTPPVQADPADLRVDERLRAPLLAQDWAAWAEAWHALDAGPIAELAAHAGRGNPVALTLAGERYARRFDSKRRSVWQRLMRHFRGASADQLLGEL
jgi:hypothetical protein